VRELGLFKIKKKYKQLMMRLYTGSQDEVTD
jgi:hypothetical protein